MLPGPGRTIARSSSRTDARYANQSVVFPSLVFGWRALRTRALTSLELGGFIKKVVSGSLPVAGAPVFRHPCETGFHILPYPELKCWANVHRRYASCGLTVTGRIRLRTILTVPLNVRLGRGPAAVC